jgi:hypothetical protein
VSSKFTLNYGLRIEHEDGMREVNNNFTVGFDPQATSALSSVTIPGNVDPSGGDPRAYRAGGLMFAGVDGNKEYQGNPPKVKWSPRVGAVYSLNSKTVLRGGYGLYWAPWNYPVPSSTTSNFGQVGFTQNTSARRRRRRRPISLANPFPNGLVRRAAALPGRSRVSARRSASSIKSARRRACSSTRLTCSASCRTRWRSGSATSARAATTCRSAARSTPSVNINQLDPKYLALGARCSTAGPESVLRHRAPAAGQRRRT